MLDKLLAAGLGQPDFIKNLLADELSRLEKGGYGDTSDLAKMVEERLAALGGQADQVRGVMAPLLSGVGRSVLEAMDLPSRTEILALTQALQEAKQAGVVPAGSADSSDEPAPADEG